MGLSGSEVLLVLRAQDRATSVINRLSSTMSRLDRESLASSNRATLQSERNLKALQRSVHDVQYQYQRMTLDARKAYMEAGKDSKTRTAEYQKAMMAAREYRVENMRQIQLAKQATEDQISQARETIKAINEENEARRDSAKKLMAQGTAAIATGTSMVYMGTQGIRAYGNLIKASADYANSAKYTFTQVDKGKASLKQIEDIGIEVGKKVPAAFDEIQPALYDIWSSIDVNVNQSKKLLTQFAKDTIAGQTDMSVATRANLAIMNAYGVSVKDASDVSDFMFQLVRKGVGTYTQFANTIGRVIPSAKKADVSLDDLGGTLTFLTRNGLSAAMAATSSARAFDALSNPKTADNLKSMGIDIIDMHGNLKPVPKILEMMNSKMKDMNASEKNSFLQQAFNRSGGTIQAMRAFNLIFKDFDTYKKRLKEMTQDSGAAQTAFNQMADSPKVKWQQFLNQVKALEIELGNKLLPAALKVVGWATKMITWFDHLNPTLKTTIVYAGAIGSGLLVLAGIATILVGGLAILVGSVRLLGTTSIGSASGVGKLAGGLTALSVGMATAHNATTQTGKAVGILESTMGGAMAGSIFGPWGTAIGGAVGALGGFIAALHGSGNAADDAKTHYADIIGTLNKTTGAYTKATAAAVANQLNTTDSGKKFLQFVQAYGVSAETVGKAATGQKKALAQVNSVMALQQGQINDINRKTQSYVQQLDALKNTPIAPDNSNLRSVMEQEKHLKSLIDSNKDLVKQKSAITDFWTGQQRSLGQQQNLLKKNVAQLNAYKLTLHGMPKDMALNITSGGGKQTIQEVKQIAAAYDNLTRKDYKILLKAEGIPTTKANIQSIVSYVNNIKTKPIGVSANTSAAQESISRIKAYLDSLHDKTLTVSVRRMDIAGAGNATLNKQHSGGFSPRRALSLTPRMIPGDVSPRAIPGMLPRKQHQQKALSPFAKAIAANLMKGAAKSTVLGQVNSTIRGHISGKGATKKESAAINALSRDYDKLIKQQVKFKKLAVTKSGVYYLTADKMPLAKAIKQINADLKTAQDRLKTAQDTYNDFKSQISSSVTDFGSLGSLTQPTDVFGNTQAWTASNINSQLSGKLATIKKWGANLKTIRRMYGDNTYRQALAMGPDGADFAQALVNATPAQATAIRNNVNAIVGQGGTIGKQAADNLYLAGVQSAQGLVNGLLSQQSKVKAAAEKIADSINKAVKKKLKIHSPSKEAIGVAVNYGGTLADHLHRQRRQVSRASTALAKEIIVNPKSANLPPVVGANSKGPRDSQKPPVQITQHITTQEIDPRKHAADLGWELVSRYNL
jgi:TP901 family phage tail tape measure protein